MSLEIATFIPQLIATNPDGDADFVDGADDHLRLIKAVLVNQLGSLGNNALTVTALQLNTVPNLAPTANPTFTGHVTVPTPVLATDAVSKAYADALSYSAGFATAVECGAPLVISPAGNIIQLQWQTITGNTTCVAGGNYRLNSTGGSFTAKLPIAPVANQVVRFKCLDGVSGNPVTIDPQGAPIEKTAGTMNVALDYKAFSMTYVDATYGWVIT